MGIQPPHIARLDVHAEKIRQLELEQKAEEASKQAKAEERQQSPFSPPERRASPTIQLQEIIFPDSID